MSNKVAQYSNQTLELNLQNLRERPNFPIHTSNVDCSSIDLILVYECQDSDNDNESQNSHGNLSRRDRRPTARRERFEDYLAKKQGLVLTHVKSTSNQMVYVKVHTPFDILLLAAENMRMRLPIEKIETDSPSTQYNEQTCWSRCTQACKRPFRLDPSLIINDPDYYTAIYSSNIDKFKELFDTLRGSRDLYFTSAERSLLTYELLSRAQFDYNEDDDDDDGDENEHHENEGQTSSEFGKQIIVIKPALGKFSKRPGIDRLVSKHVYKCYFPIHESLRDNLSNLSDSELNDREKLKKYWATMRKCFKFQPLSVIRSYMGEKVAFYFAFFGFYNQMLIPAALVGLIIFIYGISTVFTDRPTSDICGEFGQSTHMCPRCDNDCPFWKLSDSCLYSKISYVFDNAATVIFSVLMSLWARWFIEFWKRRQSALQYDWDSIGFEEHLEPIRPQFENKFNKNGEKRINPITGIEEPYVPTKKRIPFYLIAFSVVVLMMAIVCGTVFGTIVYRSRMNFILKKTSVKEYSSIIITVTSAMMNLISSVVLSQFYYWIARKLTDWELHKYQSAYDNSLTLKIYLFQFVNFYSSLFYIAFFKGRFIAYPSEYGDSGSGGFSEQCDPAGCLVELSIQFFIIMVGKQFINNILEFITAMSRTIIRACRNHGESEAQKQWEIDNDLFNFNSNTLLDEYLELVIQFGFVTLFVTAFPLAPLFALFNNFIEIRLDAWKFLSKYKRPIPFKAFDIGIWDSIISAVSYLAVLTNAIVIAWTSEFIPKMAYRSLDSSGASLIGYVNWTLSSFTIDDYNLTNTIISGVPTNLTACRYRDFREPTGPLYSHTVTYWNVTAARLAFIIVFEHIVYFIVYLMQWLVPDVPKQIQNKIDHERYIEQRERWTSKTTKTNFQNAIITSRSISNMINNPSDNSIVPPTTMHSKSAYSKRRRSQRQNAKSQSLPDEN